MLDNNLYLEKLDDIYNFTYNDVNIFGINALNGHIGLPNISSEAKIYLSTNSITDELIRFAYGADNFTAIRVNNNGELNFSNKIIFSAGSETKSGGLQVQPGLLKTITSVLDTGSIEFDGFNFYFINSLGNRQTFGTSSGTTTHSELTSLQGGVSGQYYHLTSTQHTVVVNLIAVNTNGILRKNNNDFTTSAVTWDEIINKPVSNLQATLTLALTDYIVDTNVANSVKYIIESTLVNDRQISELLITRKQTTAYITEYGIIHTSTDPLVSYDVSITDSVNLNLIARASTGGAGTTLKIIKTLFA